MAAKTAMDLLTEFVAAGANKWDELTKRNGPLVTGDSDPVRLADSYVMTYARIGAYIDARGAGQSHEAAMRHADKREKAVRKALGYTHP